MAERKEEISRRSRPKEKETNHKIDRPREKKKSQGLVGRERRRKLKAPWAEREGSNLKAR